MIVLGFDTATLSTTVGLRLADGSTLQARDDPAPGEHPGHATRLLSMADSLLARAGLGWASLERIAVGLGPGRFTGLRVGIATARGLAQSRSLELVGVSTLQTLAEGAMGAGDGASDRVLAVIDALRGEVFAGAFARAGGGSVCEAALPRPLAPDQLEGILARVLPEGPAAGWLAVGDGALSARAQLAGAGVIVAGEDSPLHALSAAALCDIGARSRAASSYEEIVPDYRRRPDAERARGRGPGGERLTASAETAR